ncbi:putative trafficking protein particle complex subunit 10 [Apostichopus japonicus]|uniref:Putative trafficking protein particle complex subunit 10 n=1 Tax=Stichopus japonicus TaxID=307972 RepID=A0A2G8JJV6_STIJA|nr:putative trafficking protein particle complex subunit 10 [Apostichopus japonicus]
MGDPLLEEEKKSHYSEQVTKTAKEISANFLSGDDESEVWIPFQSSFGLKGITIVDKTMSCSRNDEVRLKVELFSRLSSPVTLKTISLCFQDETPNDPGSPASSHSLTGLSLSSLERQKSQDSLDFYVVKDSSWFNQREIVPDVQAEVKTAEGTKKQIALVTCRNLSAILRRQDSSTSWGKAKGHITRDACSEAAVLNNVTLDPGRRSLEFIFKSDENGQYRANQLVLELMDGVSYLLNLDTVRPMVIEVFSPEPQLTVDIPDDPHQRRFAASQILRGLYILPTEHETYAVRTEGGRCHLQFLEDVDCNKDMVYPVMVLSTIGIHLEDGGDDETINHIGQELELEVPCPWHETVTRALHFNYPFTVTHRCRTIKTKKFIQISVTNISDAIIQLSSVDLEVEDVSSEELEQIQQPAPQIVGPKQTHSFVWSLLDLSNSSCKSCLFEFSFTLRTCPSSSSGPPPEGRVQYVFGIADLKVRKHNSSLVADEG